MIQSLRACVVEFGKYGLGSDFDLNKFQLVEAEEKQRNTMGLSAANKCVILTGMVDGMALEMGGKPSGLS